MKKSILFFTVVILFSASSLQAQGDLLKKVTGSMKDELFGTRKGGSKDPEPSCSCNDAEQIVNLDGNLQIDYKEMNITTMDDGSLLLKNRMNGNYYVARENSISGPFPAGDSRIAGFEETDDNMPAMEALVIKNKEYIKKTGEKYIINFRGKTYGPYSRIDNFVVTQSKDKFAATVVENVIAIEDESKKMEEAIENAKTDQEKMDLAMQYTMQMQEKMMEAGGPSGITPKLITNIPDAMDDLTGFLGGTIKGNIKYDDIFLVYYNKINDLKGKAIMELKPEHKGVSEIFLNSTDTKYAVYSYGSITLSDGKTLTDLFNPHLIKVGGQVFLAYMYYSPKKNSLMQCKIPF